MTLEVILYQSSSTAWRPISQKDKGIFNIEPNSGEFCMSFDDFKKHFTDVTICSISENELASDDTGQFLFKKKRVINICFSIMQKQSHVNTYRFQRIIVIIIINRDYFQS